MKKHSGFVFTIIFSVFLFTSLAATETKAQDLVNKILKRMDDNYVALKTLQASVSYLKYESTLNDKTERQGKAYFISQDGRKGFRIDWTRPEESLAVINNRYVLYQPKNRQAIVGSTESVEKNPSSAGNPLYFITMSKAQMKANYTIKYIGEEKVNGTTATWHLELTPKTPQKYKVADLWVDPNGMPLQMKITANNKDTESILLTNLDINGKRIDAGIFKIDLPNNVKIINK